MLQETFDELCKELQVARTLGSVIVEHTVKRDGRKDGIA